VRSIPAARLFRNRNVSLSTIKNKKNNIFAVASLIVCAAFKELSRRSSDENIFKKNLWIIVTAILGIISV
jgi:uncharacterized membrane protein